MSFEDAGRIPSLMKGLGLFQSWGNEGLQYEFNYLDFKVIGLFSWEYITFSGLLSNLQV